MDISSAGVKAQNNGVIPLTGGLVYWLSLFHHINRLFKLWQRTSVHIFCFVFFFLTRGTKGVCFTEREVPCTWGVLVWVQSLQWLYTWVKSQNNSEGFTLPWSKKHSPTFVMSQPRLKSLFGVSLSCSLRGSIKLCRETKCNLLVLSWTVTRPAPQWWEKNTRWRCFCPSVDKGFGNANCVW